jgi:hypothetical protein
LEVCSRGALEGDCAAGQEADVLFIALQLIKKSEKCEDSGAEKTGRKPVEAEALFKHRKSSRPLAAIESDRARE